MRSAPPTPHRPPRLAFVCPRLHEPGTVGGAETLLYALARDAAAAGCTVSFLTTCARNHFTWANEAAPGREDRDQMEVRRFPVDSSRDTETFLRLQAAICRGESLSDAEEDAWLRESVNSAALIDTLRVTAPTFDRIITGPYLFGLTEAVTRVDPARTLLIPCLHDEAFARVGRIQAMFHRVRGCLFNTEPERLLAHRLYPGFAPHVESVVAMGIPPFEVDPGAFARRTGLSTPYVLYAGRREPLKGTPLLLDYVAAFRERTGQDLSLVLTGSGDVEIPTALRPHVLDLGFVSEQEKREAMAGATVFCHPSVHESLSIVLIESWLAGTPALVHARGEVLRWQCRAANGGLWFRNYPEFEEALRWLLGDDKLRTALARNGAAFARRMYAPEAVLERFLAAVRAGPPLAEINPRPDGDTPPSPV